MWQKFKNVYHLLVAFLANVYFGWPSKKLTVIGVTGTDGKTTTVHLIYHILRETSKNVSMISSLGAVINGKNYNLPFHVTTPSSWKLQSFLSLINKLTIPYTLYPKPYLVLEVTSHALDQYRVWGIDFAVGVLTNVTHEHLDYHKTYENYVATKTKLLRTAKVAVVNKDDNSYGVISNFQFLISNFKTVTYGIKKDADVTGKKFPFKTKLVGEFNRYNILAAVAVCRTLGVSDGDIRKAIMSFKLPIGRMETVYQDNFLVMIDFAHTPNALENVLLTVKPTVKGGLIHVFGSAGERDRQKRPEMGKISAKYADIIVLTAEDPRSESVGKIMEEIESGIKNYELRFKNSTLFKILDRQEAISFAVRLAKKGDVVLITGKGHERSMNYGKGEIPWSEHKAVWKALGKR